MDAVQKQIVALSHKIDTLYQLIDQLSGKVSDSLVQIKQLPCQEANSLKSAGQFSSPAYQSQSLLDSVMEHKDVLVDSRSEFSNSPQNGDNTLSADIQVQRLTAQLTAAYNRIAALEEQLLTRRIHS